MRQQKLPQPRVSPAVRQLLFLHGRGFFRRRGSFFFCAAAGFSGGAAASAYI
jgi:hypothetical protein